MKLAETIPYAQLLLRLARVELRINDIPIALKDTDGITNIMTPIREFLVSGRNSARFTVAPDDIPQAYKEGGDVIQEGSAVRMRIAQVEDGEFLDFVVGEELLDIAVRLSSQDVPPITRSGTFEAKAVHRWAWTMAQKIDPVRDRKTINAFVGKVSEMFATLDAAGLIEAMQPSIADRAKAYPMIDEHHRKLDIRNALGRQDPKTWKPMPFDPDRALYRSVAEGRLIQPLDLDGLPLVRTETDTLADPAASPGYYPFPMMIGYKGGELAILL